MTDVDKCNIFSFHIDVENYKEFKIFIFVNN